jgi:hypothetical protein
MKRMRRAAARVRASGRAENPIGRHSASMILPTALISASRSAGVLVVRGDFSGAYPSPSAEHAWPCYPVGMDTSEAGRLRALATNKKLTKKQRKANARKAAKAHLAKKKYEPQRTTGAVPSNQSRLDTERANL